MSKNDMTMDRRDFTKAAFSAGLLGTVLIAGLNPFSPFASTPAYADPTSAEKQAEADETKKRLDEWGEKLDKASADYFTAIEEHDAAVLKMGEAQAQIESTEAEVSRLQLRLNDRAAAMYKQGDVSFLQVLFGSSSFSEFTTSWQLLSSITESDASLIEQSKQAKQEAQSAHDEFAAQEKIALEKQNLSAEIKAEAEETHAALEAELANLEAEVAELIEKERIEEERRQAEAAAAAAAAAAADQGGYTGRPAPPYNSITGNAVVDRALGCRGYPYVWGAVGPYSFDCSGLVSYALSGSFRRLGTTYTFMGWPRVFDPQPGDVCTHSTHCGIYYGGGQMIHASTYGVGVIIGPVQSGMIYVRY